MLTEPRQILITGATRGLGRAMVERCIEAGHIVWACGRTVESIAQLKHQFNQPHRFHVVDVASDEQVGEWARDLLSNGLAPDLILNNAAMINPNAPLWEMTAEQIDDIVDVNLKGTIHVIRHFVPAMVQRKQGVIVNFSSGWGRSVSAEVAPYCATKWAIEGLTLALAQELPAGMAAAPFNPGIINTEMLRSCFGGSAHHYPDAEAWSLRAVPFLLKVGPKQNGQQLSCPGAE